MTGPTLWAVILAAGAVTYAIRASFLVGSERVGTLPPRVRRGLSYVPAAVLAALVAPEFLAVAPGEFSLPRLLAGVLAALVAWRTGSVVATIAAGLLAVTALGAVL